MNEKKSPLPREKGAPFPARPVTGVASPVRRGPGWGCRSGALLGASRLRRGGGGLEFAGFPRRLMKGAAGSDAVRDPRVDSTHAGGGSRRLPGGLLLPKREWRPRRLVHLLRS